MILIGIICICLIILSILCLLAKSLPDLRSSVLAYGKLNETADKPRTQWANIVSHWTVPKSWFSHFYFVGVIFSIYCWFEIVLAMLTNNNTNNNKMILGPLFSILRTWDTAYGSQHLNWNTCLIGLTLMTLHLSRRVYETWYIERPSPYAKMHISHYLTGLGFYGAMVFGTWLEGVASLGLWQDQIITTNITNQLNMSYFNIIISIGLFMYSSIHQYKCHKILASLRTATNKKKETTTNKTGYAIPHGDWFEIWVAPHYICDILIYCSLCILYQGKSMILLCGLIWTFLNLSVTAIETKSWYIQTFPNYPKNHRWIVIPGLF